MVAKIPLSLVWTMRLTSTARRGVMGSAASGLGSSSIPAATTARIMVGRRTSSCAFCLLGANNGPPYRSRFADDARSKRRGRRCGVSTCSPLWVQVTGTSRRMAPTLGLGSSAMLHHLYRSSRLLATSSEVSNIDEKRMDQPVEVVPSVGAGSRVCVIAPDESSFFLPEDESCGKESSAPPSFDVFIIAESLAANLSLPFIVENGNVEDRLEEQTSGRVEGCTHCLRIVPYERESVRSYALAIQPLLANGDGGGGGKNSRRKGKRQRKSDPMASMKPFFVDFVPPAGSKMDKRLGKNQRGGGSELLLKAIAPGKVAGGAVVYDLTAGFGQDSAIVAAAGGASEVHMVERDPIVAALLGDALRRLRVVAESGTDNFGGGDFDAISRAAELASKLTLEVGEGVDAANRFASHDGDESQDARRPDICYLDPMFPPRTKSAAVKKNMQILHGLLQSNNGPERRGEESDMAESLSESLRLDAERSLLDSALRAAQARVVVKRPVQAPPLGGEKEGAHKPSYSVRGSVNRWDVYVKQ